MGLSDARACLAARPPCATRTQPGSEDVDDLKRRVRLREEARGKLGGGIVPELYHRGRFVMRGASADRKSPTASAPITAPGIGPWQINMFRSFALHRACTYTAHTRTSTMPLENLLAHYEEELFFPATYPSGCTHYVPPERCRAYPSHHYFRTRALAAMSCVCLCLLLPCSCSAR